MKPVVYFWLFVAGLAVNLSVGAFEHSAGYMDADYYYAGGIRLAQGRGFSELVLWNYLDDPQSLPHPSHSYWYPLASLVAAAGILLGGSASYQFARIGFFLISAFVAPVTAALALRLTRFISPEERLRPDLAITAGALALFPTYLTAFLPATDNYSIYMVLGGLFMLLSDRGRRLDLFLAGVCAGLMSLARSDGLLWAGLGLLFIGLRSYHLRRNELQGKTGIRWLPEAGLFLLGFALLTAPWYARNLAVFGTPITPGGGRAFFLREYADTFAYPPTRLTPVYLLSEGWRKIVTARWQALSTNLDATLTIQISLLLLPFAILGIWRLRHDTIVHVGIAAWAMLLLTMSLVFPFAGPRGSFTHAGTALYPLWWSSSVAGLGLSLDWVGKRGLKRIASRRNLILATMVVLNAALSIYMAYARIGPLDWDRFSRVYRPIEERVVADGAHPGRAIIVIDPPAYFTATGRPALIIPDENKAHLMALAEKFGAGYLVLEKEHLGSGEIKQIYDSPDSDPAFKFLGQVEDAKLFRIDR